MPKDKGTSWGVRIGWLSSLKLTLVLFFALAGASLIGTLLPQGISLLDLKSHFSPAIASLIDLLALNNLYHSMWFRILLLLLCANLIACTVDRLPKTGKSAIVGAKRRMPDFRPVVRSSVIRPLLRCK